MAKEIHGVVQLDRVTSSKVGHLFSVLEVNRKAMDNGSIGVIGKKVEAKPNSYNFIEGKREVFELEEIKGNEEGIVIVVAPELRYEQYSRTDDSVEYFYNKAGEVVRAYTLEYGDILSLSNEALTLVDEESNQGGKIGNFVVPEVGSRLLKEVDTKPTTGAFIGEIVDKRLLGTSTRVGDAGDIVRPIQLNQILVRRNTY